MTFTETDTTTTAAIASDRWDQADLAEMRKLGPLEKVEGTLAQASPVGADGMADLFASLLRARPTLTPAEQMAPSHAVNRAVMAAALDEDAHKDLRRYTVGDPVSTALGVITFAESMTSLYSRLAHVQDQADAAQAAADALEEMMASVGGGEIDEATQAAIDELSARAQTEMAELATDIEEARPSVGRAVRAGLAAAATEAADQAEVGTAWGMGPGEMSKMDPTQRLALAAKLSTPRMRKIAELLGALRSLSLGERKRRTTTVADEIYDVELGGNLARVLPSELIGLLDETLELDFLRRLAAGELLSYALRGNERVGAGAIIYVEDSSSSMATDGRDIWSKALGLALLGIARDERRAFHAICFGGPGQSTSFSFPAPADYTTAKMLAFAEAFLDSAGTSFSAGLEPALSLLAAEHEATGKVAADIVFATDGQCQVSKTWLANFTAERERLGAKCYGLALGGIALGEPMVSICDSIATVADLTSGEEVRSIFRGLS